MGAILYKEKKAHVDLIRCIGCGLCVTTCKDEAIKLKRKSDIYIPPDTTEDLMDRLMEERPNKLNGKLQIPDYWIEYSISDLVTGKDPYLKKIKELIGNASR